MSQRFFVESPIEDASLVTLVGQEAQHLGRVMRASVGDAVIVFDGCGAEYQGSVQQVSRSEVKVAIEARIDADRELTRSITLAVAMPKGDRQKWLVEKAVELGVSQLLPLQTQRGVAQPTQSALKRLRRSVIEASKQCGRNRLMTIAEPVNISQMLQQAEGAAHCWLAHPGAAMLHPPTDQEACWAAIGPEGGFTNEEVAEANEAGWGTVGLGPRILRIETAAVCLASLLSHG